MQFIDNSGHIFEMKSYNQLPIGYEFETTETVFWFDNEYSNKLSVNNYYVLPIRMLFKSDDEITDISIEDIKSDIYSFGKIDNENPEIKESELSKTLSSDYVYYLDNIPVNSENNDETLYKIGTFYVFANTEVEGTWMTTINIKIVKNGKTEWCPITVAGSFVDEIEQLIINARNIGVKLPKDIIKAVYQASFDNDVIDENLYNLKLKEYLINHMILKSQCGNYNSAYAALKWFGWGEHIELSKLLLTDNEFAEQYIHDYFDINSDILDSFRKFRNTTYIALTLYTNRESGNIYPVDDTKSLWGEGKPILENLLEKEIEDTHAGISFVKSYYDYSFNELTYKIACLAHMYKQYFLPLHLSIHSATVQERVFANDIKLLNSANVIECEQPILISDLGKGNYFKVWFNDTNKYILSNISAIIDQDYNIFSYYTQDFCESSEQDYIFVDNKLGVTIPIYFAGYVDNKPADTYFYDCVLIFSRNNNVIKESHFSFTQSQNVAYTGFNITPILFNEYTMNNAEFWEDCTFTIDLLCNGKWFKYNFTIDVPEFFVSFNKLQYVYDPEYHKQLREISNYTEDGITRRFIDFNAVMYEPDLVTISNSNFNDEIANIMLDVKNDAFNNSFSNAFINLTDISMLNSYIELTNQIVKISDNAKYYNKVHIYDLLDEFGNHVLYNDAMPFTNVKEFNFKEETISLYSMFFDKFGNVKKDSTNKDVLTYLGNDSSNYEYDFYLMHDTTKYFVVFISKDTVNNAPVRERVPKIINYVANIPDTIIAKPFDDTTVSISSGDDTPHNFILKHYKSNNLFLINRMKAVDNENIYHFDADDIVITKVNNIQDLPFKMSLGTKWTFEKISIGGESIEPVTSNTNAAIMSIDKDHTKYVRGFYNVTINYSIDDYFNHNKTLTTKIRIN